MILGSWMSLILWQDVVAIVTVRVVSTWTRNLRHQLVIGRLSHTSVANPCGENAYSQRRLLLEIQERSSICGICLWLSNSNFSLTWVCINICSRCTMYCGPASIIEGYHVFFIPSPYRVSYFRVVQACDSDAHLCDESLEAQVPGEVSKLMELPVLVGLGDCRLRGCLRPFFHTSHAGERE